MKEQELIKNFCDIHGLEVRSYKPVKVYDRVLHKEIKPDSFEDMVDKINKLRTQWLNTG